MNIRMSQFNPVASEPAVLKARQVLYRFAALSLLDPQAGSWGQLDEHRCRDLVSRASELIRTLEAAAPEQLGLGEMSLDHLDPGRVFDRLPAKEHELNAQYESTFGLLVSNACPPYEMEYIDSKFSFQRSNLLADVSGFYRAFGVSVSLDRPERPDHIVLEFEFMATVIGLQINAAADGHHEATARQQICRDAQFRFFQEHLAWWVPVFAKLLQIENKDGFYGAVGEFLAALIPAERALLGVERVEALVGPTSVERPEECEGCQLVV